MTDQANVPNSLPPAAYGPITAGQMFERTFTLLRENFKLFFGIVLVLIGVEVIFGGLLVTSVFWMGQLGASPAPIARLLFIFPAVLVGAVLFFILIQIIEGALFVATQAKLAAAPTSVGEACKHAADKAGRLIGIALLVLLRTIGYLFLFYVASGVVALVLALMFGAFRHVAGATPYAFVHGAAVGTIALVALLVLVWIAFYLLLLLWLWARYALSIPAALAEGLPITESIRRSIHLSHRSRGRLYALLVAMMGVDLAIAAVTVPLQLLLHHGGNMHAGAALSASGILLALVRLLVYAFVMAFIGVATALCYYDLRVRKEGFGAVPPPEISVPAAESWPIPPDAMPGDLPIS